MSNSFYSAQELATLGLKTYGKNVLISKKASIFGADQISIGDHVRIDDFCVLSGHIELGNYVHIAVSCCLFGGDAGIYMGDFTTISSRGAIYAISDDYSGEYMTNPMVPEELRNVEQIPVYINRHSIIGTGSTILCGSTLGEGTSVGAMSLVKGMLEPWYIYAGVPCKKIKPRKRAVAELAFNARSCGML